MLLIAVADDVGELGVEDAVAAVDDAAECAVPAGFGVDFDTLDGCDDDSDNKKISTFIHVNLTSYSQNELNHETT